MLCVLEWQKRSYSLDFQLLLGRRSKYLGKPVAWSVRNFKAHSRPRAFGKPPDLQNSSSDPSLPGQVLLSQQKRNLRGLGYPLAPLKPVP